MKRMKKMIAVLLAAVLVLGMNLNVFAEVKTTTGTLSIGHPIAGQKYSVYLMFDLEEYDDATGAYLYTANDELWERFVNEDETAKTYLEIYGDNHVRIKSSDTEKYIPVVLTDDNKADLAKAAIAWAETNKIQPTVTFPLKEGETDVYGKTGLELGYYVVSSTAGSLCGLTTTDPSAEINEKNEQPTVTKQVLEDINNNGEIDTGDTWGEKNDDEIGDTVYYKTTITAKKGAFNYVLHDRMDNGLTLNKTSIVVKENGQESPLNGYMVTGDKEALNSYETYDYYVLYDQASDASETEVCDFEVHFTEKYLKTIGNSKDIIVSYEAVLNENAAIYTNENRNGTYLEYGDDNFTTESITKTYTYMIDVIKTDINNKVLEGAQFQLYREDPNGANTIKDKDNNEIKVGSPVKFISEGTGVYEITDDGTTGAIDTITAGDIVIRGLDVGTYYLQETVAPKGYNKVDYPIKVEIVRDATTQLGNNNIGYVNNGVYDAETGGGYQVINQTGSLLPNTGGMGTTMIYVTGSILVVAAVVILVTKKRMSGEK